METFPTRLKELRLEKGLTLKELSENLNTTNTTLSRYENSLREPKVYTLKEISNYFNVSVDYLLGNTDERKYVAYHGKDVELILRETINKLENTEGLMLDGKPLTKESLDIILLSIEIGIAIVKKRMNILK